MPFLESDGGVRLHYRDQGQGTPMVFLHAMGATADVWNYQVMALHSNFRCICPELRGHGASDKPVTGYGFDILCRDVQNLITTLDLNDVTLVGHSFTGALCMLYLLNHNQDGRVTRAALLGGVVPRLADSQRALRSR